AALLRRPDRLAERELCALSRSDRRDPCQVAAREWRDRKTLAAGLRRVPGRLHQSRPRPERLSHRGPARRGAVVVAAAASAFRHPVRAAGLQAAIRPPDPGRAADGWAM